MSFSGHALELSDDSSSSEGDSLLFVTKNAERMANGAQVEQKKKSILVLDDDDDSSSDSISISFGNSTTASTLKNPASNLPSVVVKNEKTRSTTTTPSVEDLGRKVALQSISEQRKKQSQETASKAKADNSRVDSLMQNKSMGKKALDKLKSSNSSLALAVTQQQQQQKSKNKRKPKQQNGTTKKTKLGSAAEQRNSKEHQDRVARAKEIINTPSMNIAKKPMRKGEKVHNNSSSGSNHRDDEDPHAQAQQTILESTKRLTAANFRLLKSARYIPPNPQQLNATIQEMDQRNTIYGGQYLALGEGKPAGMFNLPDRAGYNLMDRQEQSFVQFEEIDDEEAVAHQQRYDVQDAEADLRILEGETGVQRPEKPPPPTKEQLEQQVKTADQKKQEEEATEEYPIVPVEENIDGMRRYKNDVYTTLLQTTSGQLLSKSGINDIRTQQGLEYTHNLNRHLSTVLPPTGGISNLLDIESLLMKPTKDPFPAKTNRDVLRKMMGVHTLSRAEEEQHYLRETHPGEPPCMQGDDCVINRLQSIRKTTCPRMMTPEERVAYIKNRSLPDRPGLCILCNRVAVTYVYYNMRCDYMRARSDYLMQNFANRVNVPGEYYHNDMICDGSGVFQPMTMHVHFKYSVETDKETGFFIIRQPGYLRPPKTRINIGAHAHYRKMQQSHRPSASTVMSAGSAPPPPIYGRNPAVDSRENIPEMDPRVVSQIMKPGADMKMKYMNNKNSYERNSSSERLQRGRLPKN